jgi:hypothetical protein
LRGIGQCINFADDVLDVGCAADLAHHLLPVKRAGRYAPEARHLASTGYLDDENITGVDGDFAGHRLRARFVTAAAQKKVPKVDIMRVTGHRSTVVLRDISAARHYLKTHR